MAVDRLDALLQRFSVSARMFHSGPLCGVTNFPATADTGQLHLVRNGEVHVHHGGRKRELLRQPSLIFYPRPLRHRLVTDAKAGADMACAHVTFNAGAINPIAQALPDVVVMPLEDMEEAAPVLDALFREAFTQRCGRQQIVDRLFEVVIILILRTLLNRSMIDSGLLGGMAHPQIAKAMVAVHARPEAPWTLASLARRAGMSRSHFAQTFRERTGTTPAEYLARHRIYVAQHLLRKGATLKLAAEQVGYGGASALSRAFRALCGQSPRQWKAAQRR